MCAGIRLFFVLKSTSCPFPLPHCITGTYIYQIAWVAHCRVKLTNERHCRKTGRWKEGRSKSISLSLFFSFCLCSKSSISFMFPDSASEPLALWSQILLEALYVRLWFSYLFPSNLRMELVFRDRCFVAEHIHRLHIRFPVLSSLKLKNLE